MGSNPIGVTFWYFPHLQKSNELLYNKSIFLDIVLTCTFQLILSLNRLDSHPTFFHKKLFINIYHVLMRTNQLQVEIMLNRNALPLIQQQNKGLQLHIFYIPDSNMEALRKQNEKIQKSIENYLQEIEKQKQLNAQHQTQIETLLKFNERLLGIIQNQLQNNRNERASLQPISERSQRESDLVVGQINSFIRTRKFGPISQRGSATSNSLIQRATFGGHKLDHFAKDMKSELNHSSQEDHSEQRSDFRPQLIHKLPQKVNASNQVKNEMLHEIEELKKIKKERSTFYDNKMSQIKNLSVKINKFHPLQKLNQINQKLNISAGTASLLQKIINKG